MNKILKITLWGAILWLILFIVGFILWPLHESQFLLFKTIMVVSSALVGMVMLAMYFKKVDSNFLNEAILLGVIWLTVNWLLDLVVLVGMFKSPLGEYIIGIGLRYLNIPITSIGVGYILKNKQ